MGETVRIVTEDTGKLVFVGSPEMAQSIIEPGYRIEPATEGNERWWNWFFSNCVTKSLVAQAALHGTYELGMICQLVGEDAASWQGYFDACQAGGATNREWDPVLWKVIKTTKLRIVRKLQNVA